MEICDVCKKERIPVPDQGWRRLENDSDIIGWLKDGSEKDYLVCSWECAYALCKRYKEE